MATVETIAIHYNDFIMSTVVSQITSLTIVYSIVYPRRRSKKTSKLRVTCLCEGNSPVNSRHKWPVTREMLPLDDVIMSIISHMVSLFGPLQHRRVVKQHRLYTMVRIQFWVTLIFWLHHMGGRSTSFRTVITYGGQWNLKSCSQKH